MSDDALRDRLRSLNSEPGVYWAPIRHHSPGCSLALQRLMEDVSWDVVLIEAPSDANHLMEHLQAKDAEPPLALYMFHAGQSQDADSQSAAGRYRCFAPFAAMSPEFIALRRARDKDRPAHFIDLPYARQIAIQPEHDAASGAPDPLYADDTHLATADPLTHLVTSSNCRDFNEWWDRHFENAGASRSASEYFDHMHLFCLLIRAHASVDSVTVARERHMAEHIRAYRDQGMTCLVVTGGFHCAGIQDHLQSLKAGHPAPAEAPGDVYLVPYSLDRLNRANGYAAGLPDCGYYDNVWRAAQSSSLADDAMRNLSLQLMGVLRKAGYSATLPDAIELNLIAQRLADLRGTSPGRPELRDAIESSLRKSERTADHHDPFDEVVSAFLRGDATGSLPRSVPVSPLVRDFREQCAYFRLPYKALAPVEKALSVYRSERHRDISRLLHQLDFLRVPYATLIAGPRFAQQQDLERVREVWNLEWTAETDALLTECSHLGGRIQEAAFRLALLEMRGAHGAQHVTLLVRCLAMGLHDLLEPIVEAIQRWLKKETDPVILSDSLARLMVIDVAQSALGRNELPDFDPLLRALFERTCVRLPWMGDLSEAAAAQLTDGIANLHAVVVQNTRWADADLYFSSVFAIIKDCAVHRIWGAAVASLLIGQRMSERQTADEFGKAFGHAQLAPDTMGEFVQGFLRLGRSFLIQSPALVDRISEHMAQWDEHEFLAALPSLRLAFAQLSPREIRELSLSIASTDANLLLYSPTGSWQEETLVMATRLRQQVEAYAEQWGLPL